MQTEPLFNCTASQCGYAPGTDPRSITHANPNGHRPFGSGIRFEGGDANICYTRSFSAVNCAHWAIDDTGFLGNQHVLPNCAGCSHRVVDWEVSISTHPEATPAEIRDFRTYDFPVGSPIQYAYHIENPNARGLLTSPYVEDETPPPIVDVHPPSFVIAGIGGKDTKNTRRIRARELTSIWRFANNADQTWISEGEGVFMTISAPADHPNYPY